MPKLQLKTKPHSSATAIYDNSTFETGRININGDLDGIGIFIGSTQSISGDISLGITYIDASLVVSGGAFFNDNLYVESGITSNEQVQLGIDDDAWRMRKVNDTIRWEKYNTTLNDWELMIRFSEC